MKNDSFTSLIILLVLFFVLPSLFKLLGQYTMGSKGRQESGSADEEGDPTNPREEMPVHPEQHQPPRNPLEGSGRTTISNKPIHPRWF
ncbi:MAG TPA: hypothetical protein PKM41_02830 [Deltaproteobacteria bacterium]|jgi:hypothetical protein|nr:hypothetical protein [Deltaproteobacteria bacterium]HOI05823.1 hypothetical protein [Deltaproteobacteria bacterium]